MLNSFHRLLNYTSAIFISGMSPLIAQVDISSASYPVRTDWSESVGTMNISTFVFQDRNGNGTYDIGDRPFAGIFVALGKDEQPIIGMRSNVNGFANFKASSSDIETPLSTAGFYEFVVVPPPGWYVSTENAAQIRELIEVPGSIAGFGLREMMRPVGLVPYTFVRGTVSDGVHVTTIDALRDGEVVASADIQDDGQFLIPLDSNTYVLRIGEETRPLTVDNFPIDIGTFATTGISSLPSTIINFDDLAASGLQKIPNGYGGLNWFNLNALSASFTSGSIGYQNGATSGHNVVYTSSGHPTEITHVDGFNFHSVMLTLAWPDAEGETAIIEFFRGEELILTDTVGISAFSPIKYAPMIADIDRVVIRSEHYWQVVLDDLTVSYIEN